MADKPPTPELRILGDTGLRRSGGRIHEEFHHKLRGRLGIRVYREMAENDPIIASFLFTINNLLSQVEVRSVPSGDSDRHKEEAKFLESVLDDMSGTWPDLLSEILSELVFGWSYFETVFKRRLGDSKDPSKRSRFNDGRIGVRKISIRSQDTLDRWEFDEDGGIRGAWFITQNKPGPVFIPIEKALLFRTGSHKESPESIPLLRPVYRPWFFKKRLEEIRAIGAERDLVGLPVMKVPPRIMDPAAKPEEKALRASLEELVQQIRRDEREGMVIPSDKDEAGNSTGYDFKLITSGGRRQIDLNQAIVYYDQRILIAVSAQFQLLGMDKVGSFALSSSQTALFGFMLGGILDKIFAVLNRFLLPRLFAFNGVPQEFWPHLAHGDIEQPDLEEVANYVKRLTEAGAIVPDPSLERTLREYASFPQADAKSNTPPPKTTAATDPSATPPPDPEASSDD